MKELFLAAPSGQLDSSVKPLIEKWDEPPTSLQVLEVLDQCIHGSLGSDFVVAALQAVYESRLSAEGKSHNDNVPFAVWRTCGCNNGY
jgi:hypothetical protein